MKRFSAPLALTLGLVLVVVAAQSFSNGPADNRPQSQVASQPAGPAVADVEQGATAESAAPTGQAPAASIAPTAQAPVDSTAPAAQTETPAPAEAQAVEEPAVKTGCGKAVPCPNRDCKDCPANRYLK